MPEVLLKAIKHSLRCQTSTPGLILFYSFLSAGRSDTRPLGGCGGLPGAGGMGSYSPSTAYPRLNTSSETRYGRIASFLKSLTSAQGNLQVSRYIPGVAELGLMPGEVEMKCTFLHLSHMTPMWTGMDGDYGTIGLAFWRVEKRSAGREMPGGSFLSISLFQVSLPQQG